MDKQQLFDTCVDHLFAQRTRSFDIEREICMYRGPNGTKCAVGALIKDEYYSEEMEGLTVDSHDGFGRNGPLAAIEKSIGRELTTSDVVMLLSLQQAHDRAEDNCETGEYGVPVNYGIDGIINVARMNTVLRMIALSHGLVYHDRV